MSVTELVGLIQDIITILALLTGGAVAVFVYFQLAPVLELRILPSWADDSKQFLIVKFQVENKSRVRLYSPKGRIQILEHTTQNIDSLSHWVPFEEKAILPSEKPIEWHHPEEIFRTTKQIYPGEVISIERLYRCPREGVALHIGLQVELRLGRFGRLVTRKKEAWRQTTTSFVVK